MIKYYSSATAGVSLLPKSPYFMRLFHSGRGHYNDFTTFEKYSDMTEMGDSTIPCIPIFLFFNYDYFTLISNFKIAFIISV